MRLLFWNIDKTNVTDKIKHVTLNASIDILILAECKIKPMYLLSRLNENSIEYEYLPVKNPKIKIFLRFDQQYVVNHDDKNKRWTINEIKLPNHKDFLLVSVHLPDKRNWKDSSQSFFAVELINHVKDIETKTGINNTIMIGDFNMNPFESGMVASMGLHAMNSRLVVKEQNRHIQGNDYDFFYNPMWNYLGDFRNTPGSYYLKQYQHICYHWNTFDQVIMRPSLVSDFLENELQLISSYKGVDFVDSNGIPNRKISDHLPLMVGFNLSKI